MKILFVYPVPPSRFQIPRFQQGVGMVSAVLRQAGHETALETVDRFDPAALEAALARRGPDLVALSLTSDFFRLGAEITRWIAREKKLPVVWGGVHPTLAPEESMAVDGVFALCRGEGEEPMQELCAALASGGDPSGILNLWVRTPVGIARNPLRPLLGNLDALPYADRELFDFERLLSVLPEAEFMGSRGCPHHCAYCVNHALMGMAPGPYVRYRSVGHLLGEIEAVTRRYPAVRFLGFHDDTFTLRRDWLREFARSYSARFRYPFWCNATARSLVPEVVELLAQAGCYEVRIGVESGDERIRREVLNKNVSGEEIVQAFRRVRRAGMRTYAFNMVGLPTETPATMRETVALNRRARPDSVFCSIFQPYPGTRLYDLCREQGWLTGKSVQGYFSDDTVLDQPTVGAGAVRFQHRIFADLVRWPFLGPLIPAMARVPVGGGKTLLNVWRRLWAKGLEACLWAGRLLERATGRRFRRRTPF